MNQMNGTEKHITILCLQNRSSGILIIRLKEMIILIGDKTSKRTKYFLKAASGQGIFVKTISWKEVFADFNYGVLEGAAIKIDPPSYNITDLGIMHKELLIYQDILKRMALCNCRFLNTPGAILNVLDKKKAKKELIKHNIPSTEMVLEDVSSAMQLIDTMKDRKQYSVFVKPVNYSGAAGVMALRLNPRSGSLKLYTSCRLENGRLYNTKKLYAINSSTEIINIIDVLAGKGTPYKPDIIAEKWYPKDSFNGKSYDLRVVYQAGSIAYIVARQSKGPVTNLHLNNQALGFNELKLTEAIITEIEETCQKAVSVFKGLNVAGIDVMLDKKSKKPRIIEINGQGDLIYQDIYNTNSIYNRQLKLLSGME